jgi:hypothetical protein
MEPWVLVPLLARMGHLIPDAIRKALQERLLAGDERVLQIPALFEQATGKKYPEANEPLEPTLLPKSVKKLQN